MNLRELLQYELWSKRTTRRILIWFGILVGVLTIGCAGFYETETHWLTSGERKAARVALAQIDALQSFGSFTDQDLDAKLKTAEAAVGTAERVALTRRDKSVAFALDGYLALTEGDRDEIQSAAVLWERHLPTVGSKTEFGKKLDLSGAEVRTFTRLELHRILD